MRCVSLADVLHSSFKRSARSSTTKRDPPSSGKGNPMTEDPPDDLGVLGDDGMLDDAEAGDLMAEDSGDLDEDETL
jgi:hypothetical protein